MKLSQLSERTGHSEEFIVGRMQNNGILRSKNSRCVEEQTVNPNYQNDIWRTEDGYDLEWDGRSDFGHTMANLINVIHVHDNTQVSDMDDITETSEFESYSADIRNRMINDFNIPTQEDYISEYRNIDRSEINEMIEELQFERQSFMVPQTPEEEADVIKIENKLEALFYLLNHD